MQTDDDAKNSPLAWLALFDLLQRANDRAAFDKLALQYVVQFERSAPAWDEGGKQPASGSSRRPAAAMPLLTGKLTAATAPQIDSVRSTMAKPGQHTRLDLAAGRRASTTPARDCWPRRSPRRASGATALTLERADKLRAALDILVRRGRDAGEGAWLLSLELLQFEHKQEAFDDRAIEYAVAFEQSPPSWEPPPVPPVRRGRPTERSRPPTAAERPRRANVVAWTGSMTGPSSQAMAKIVENALRATRGRARHGRASSASTSSAPARSSTRSTASKQQRKAVQIVGASPIIRALLLLIGISPRHFLKKPQ